ncbi:MarR family winged helix-turn-helix transcriptional regulator [Pseudomaricurvus sp. HS19]|uniref:MarR family winged helix-turn-helix transcriptional regulator n=1 Tax=Pseudomaricurvus sp. HS19 TaxID=2692626 RepID=UPI00136BB79F|nr:MarR family transcriptional regulator [Pseudomaricurvus sp. HS19]MYM62256.1 MarR family transcriptional regulator [Pseudomaricurvus sp. HS19]
MPRKPVDQQQAATAYYAEHNFDVSYFPAIWHTFKVGHLLTTDLERICRQHDISIADFHLLGVLQSEGATEQRATDLAQRLNVSNAVLSTRIRKLTERGFLQRLPSRSDRRAFVLELTHAGSDIVNAVDRGINTQAAFVRCFRNLSEEDQQALGRIMGELHNELDRYFKP